MCSTSTRLATLTASLVTLAMSVLVVATTWMPETVDAGTGPSLAYDPLTGQPTIAYSDGVRDDVKFARWTGAAWQHEIVDGGRDVSTGIDLAYDASERPGISYGWGALKLAEWNGSRWVVQTIEKAKALNDDTSLVYHLGEPWIAYRVSGGKGGSSVKLAHRIGSVWTTAVIDTAGAGKFNALAFDSLGRPAVAYAADPDGDNTLSSLRLARFIDNQWQIQELETGTGAGVHVDLAFDPTTLSPALVHRLSVANGTIRYLYQESGAWIPETVGLGVSPTLTFDPLLGVPVISYASSYTAAHLRLARRDSSVWTSEVVIEDAGNVGTSSLQFGPNASAPTISYELSPSGTGSTKTVKLARPGL